MVFPLDIGCDRVGCFLATRATGTNPPASKRRNRFSPPQFVLLRLGTARAIHSGKDLSWPFFFLSRFTTSTETRALPVFSRYSFRTLPANSSALSFDSKRIR